MSGNIAVICLLVRRLFLSRNVGFGRKAARLNAILILNLSLSDLLVSVSNLCIFFESLFCTLNLLDIHSRFIREEYIGRRRILSR